MLKISLKQARIGTGLKQKEVANMINVHPNTLMRWEEHPEIIPMGKVEELLGIYNVRFDEVIFMPSVETKSC